MANTDKTPIASLPPSRRLIGAAAVSLALFLSPPATAQTRATLTKPSAGCPTAAATIAVYKIANNKSSDTRPLQDAMKHYECELLDKGLEYTLISHKPLMSVIAVPTYGGFGKKAWLHVPTMYISAR